MPATDNERSPVRLEAMLHEARGLGSAVVWDRGLGQASIVDHALVNFTPGLRLVGPVHPVVTEGDILPVLQALEIIQPGHVLVIQDRQPQKALLGDIVMLGAQRRGVAGIVCSGLVRDVADAERLGLPLWAAGASPRAATLGCPRAAVAAAVVGGQSVNPGDWLFGDRDGLVHVPQHAARLVIKSAAIKDKKERLYKQRMLDGEHLVEMMNISGHVQRGEPVVVEF